VPVPTMRLGQITSQSSSTLRTMTIFYRHTIKLKGFN
jgi:hypothetical protein